MFDGLFFLLSDDCGTPPIVDKASYKYARTLEGDTVYYTCADNTVMEGLSHTTCQKDGRWSSFDLYCRGNIDHLLTKIFLDF